MTQILIVCSPGGHFQEALSFFPDTKSNVYKFVVHIPPNFYENSNDFRDVIIAPHSERDIRVFKQIYFAFKIIIKEKPHLIITTGAMIGVIFGFVGKILGVKFLFIESPTRVLVPSLSAKFSYRFADSFFVRSPDLLKKFPKAEFLS